ncbi:MAG: hypothetical protein KKH94_07430 [Candidatus Omnitrophica bacterium]|nr:hypothetical protein [Candidatus Omnitrophota bacterium]
MGVEKDMKYAIKKTFSLLLISGILFMGASCAYRYTPLTSGERIFFHSDIDSVAIIPFLNFAQKGDTVDNIAEIFSSELARYQEVRIVHPTSIARYLHEKAIVLTEGNIRREALRIGTFFNVQNVIIGTVTEYNEFYPPVLGLSLELIDVKRDRTIAARSEVYDSGFNYVRIELEEYAAVKCLTDSLYKEDLILHRFDLYMRFVCHQMVEKYF